jgi:tetratricopeptide (TPR) repeat protein
MWRFFLILLLASCSGSQTPPPEPVVPAEPVGFVEPDEPTAAEMADKNRQESVRLTNEAVDFANQGKFPEAIELFERATDTDRENHTAWFNRGLLHGHMRDHERAVEAFLEAVRIKEDDANSHYRLGKAIWAASEGDDARAQTALEAAVRLEPKHHMAHDYLGLVYEAQGKLGPAAQAWTTAATVKPDFGPAYNRLGILYLRWKKVKEAIAVLNQGRLQAKDKKALVDIFYHLGVAFTQQEAWGPAIAAHSKVLELEPDNSDALRQRGFSYAEVGDAYKAIADLEKFVKLGGGDSFFIQAANQRLIALSKLKGKRAAPRPYKEELGLGDATASLPTIPEFEVPGMVGDAHRVGELLVRGAPLLDKEIKVRGHIVWIYDCAKAIRTPGMKKRTLKKLLREQPELCTRPHFHLADSPSAKTSDHLQVVEVPRPIRPDEKKALPKEMIDNWPAVPVLKVGEEVVVTGTWATRSPMGFHNSEGLLVYKSIEKIK